MSQRWDKSDLSLFILTRYLVFTAQSSRYIFFASEHEGMKDLLKHGLGVNAFASAAFSMIGRTGFC